MFLQWQRTLSELKLVLLMDGGTSTPPCELDLQFFKYIYSHTLERTTGSSCWDSWVYYFTCFWLWRPVLAVGRRFAEGLVV